MRFRIAIGCVALVVLVSGVLFGADRAVGRNDDPALAYKYSVGFLSGVWLIGLSLPDDQLATCPGNLLLPEEASILGNFTRDGAFLSSSDLPDLTVPLTDDEGNPILDENNNPIIITIKIGHGHGTWTRTGIHTYALDSWRMATVGGELIGLAKGHSDVILNLREGTMTGDITLQLILGEGTELPPACGTLVGRRLGDN